jgi:hypothetical protein
MKERGNIQLSHSAWEWVLEWSTLQSTIILHTHTLLARLTVFGLSIADTLLRQRKDKGGCYYL